MRPTITEADLVVDGITVRATVDAVDADGAVAHVEIDWGVDETFESYALAEMYSHDYAIPGEYTIGIRVVDDAGGTSQIYSDTVTTGVPSGSILYLPFDGTTDDARGGDVRVSGTAEYETDRFGRGGRALSLYAEGSSGSGVLVSMPRPAVSNAFSLSLWVEFDAPCDGPCGNDLRLSGVGNWFNIFSPGQDLRFGMLEGLYSPNPDHDAVIAASSWNVDGEWHHYVGVLEPTTPTMYTLRLYLDGTTVGEQSVSGPVPGPPECRFYVGTFADQDLCTGRDAQEFGNFPGNIDDVRVYDRALSETEVLALFYEQAR